MDRDSPSVLIVEDSAVARRAMERLFRGYGWEVASAPTLAAGLGLLSPPPDCIVLDLMLPDGDGEAVLRKVRADDLPSRVVVATGCADPSRLERLERLGPHAVLRKPLNFTRLLGECLRGRRGGA